jgi:hypothetical protein
MSEADHLLVIVHPTALDAACTACGERSSQIHSRYERRLLHLSSQGRLVRLQVQVRRFRCRNAGCARKILGEVLNADIAPKAARRTSRLEAIVHHIGIALGGAASPARRLMLPVSRDTLISRAQVLENQTYDTSSSGLSLANRNFGAQGNTRLRGAEIRQKPQRKGCFSYAWLPPFASSIAGVAVSSGGTLL